MNVETAIIATITPFGLINWNKKVSKKRTGFFLFSELIVELKANPDWHVNSVGHTDNTGSIRYNNLLSVLRAEAVKTYLYNRGVEFKRLHAYGMGAEQPVAENLAPDGSDNPTGRAANRRVEIQLVK